MQGLHRRVMIALAMAWTATAAAQFEPQPYSLTGEPTVRDRSLFSRSHKPAPPSAYLKPVQLHVPGAKFVKVRFSEFRLPDGIIVEISNPEGSEAWRYSKYERDSHTVNSQLGDDGLQAFSAMSITGDTAIVRFTGLTSRFDPNIHSVVIDTLNPAETALSSNDRNSKGLSSPALESTCGESERQDAICWVDDHPDEYERSTPVALIITATGKKCSAWRVGRQNRLFTARHCIGSQATLDGAEIWFNYEATVCGGDANAQVVKVTGDELLASDYYLDYTLFSVNDFEKISGFGNLGLDLRNGEPGENIFIPQHGNGNPKQIALESDMNTSGLCEIDANDIDGFIEDSDIGYFCDTVSSSSGSPVISSLTGKAIALHYNGGCLNSGTKLSMIWPQVADYFGGVVPEGDADGDWAEANQPPVARFSDSCTGLDCRFDANGSEDPDGSISMVEWSLGDGTGAEGAIVEHRFEKGGDYEVELTVVDDEGATDSFMQTVTVSEPNEKPAARFSTQCVENACKFNAGSSSDSDGSVVSWNWTLGDGSKSSGQVIEHTYGEDGDYTVELTVADDDQATDQSSFTVSVQVPNTPPVARFAVDCDGLECTADASGSSDADGDLVEYRWQLGSGASTSGSNASFKFEEAGDYNIVLTVADDDGAEDSAEKSVSVASENVPPVADFSGSCELNVCGFDAGASSDSDGNIAQYQWILSTRVRDTGKTVDYTFDEEGPHTVRLTVTDDRGAESTVEKTFNITLPEDPVARFSVSCKDLQCTLDAGSSIASEGSITRYDWSFGDGATATGGNVTHEYEKDGRYTVTLKITDSAKANTTTSQTIEVEARGKIQLDSQLVSKAKRTHVVLNWTGSDQGEMVIYRNSRQLGTVNGVDTYTDRSVKNLSGSVSYRVCEAASNRCSDIKKLRLGK